MENNNTGVQKKNVALVTGGLSGEAQISYKSAANIMEQVDREKFNLFYIDICKEGWLYVSDDGKRHQLDMNDFSILQNDRKVNFDVAFMCIHGTPGEDGKLTGYFDMIGLPYTSCDTATLALTFNKKYTVALASAFGVPVAKSVLLSRKRGYHIQDLSSMRYPVFIKPNNGGSSIATFKVPAFDEGRIAGYLAKAFEVDDEVMAEEFISGRELTVGVYRSKGSVKVLPMSEVIMPADLSADQYFDFTAKYSGKTTEVTPAVVTEEIRTQVEKAAETLYNNLNCRGVVRIDFIWNDADQQAYMLEINTVPGQTGTSFIPQQVSAADLQLKDFYTELIEEAISNHKP